MNLYLLFLCVGSFLATFLPFWWFLKFQGMPFFMQLWLSALSQTSRLCMQVDLNALRPIHRPWPTGKPLPFKNQRNSRVKRLQRVFFLNELCHAKRFSIVFDFVSRHPVRLQMCKPSYQVHRAVCKAQTVLFSVKFPANWLRVVDPQVAMGSWCTVP